ncbi:DNA pilot protein [Blackfly microvirus SF02]|uniref:DNA pilot protein n=1 Tax=Blackfly microvirus SF02 TaxID=2576452 RepID=A0A4P8PJS8_9VIRU|nr:DNA pilot protein [Blackfly microvirus SF02]
MFAALAPAVISAAASIGGGLMSAGGAASQQAQNQAMNLANMNMQREQNNSNQTFQNNVNVANWQFQDKVNQENFDFAREQTSAGQAFAREQTGASQDFAREQMRFQENMSGTAYQRAMKDMRAAGLNPLLAYQQGGASTPSGAMGSALMSTPTGASAAAMGGQAFRGDAPEAKIPAINTQEELGRAVGRLGTTAIDAYRMTEDAKLKSSTRQLTESQDKKVGYDIQQVDTNTSKTKREVENVAQDTENKKEQQKVIQEQKNLVRAQSAAALARAGLDATTSAGYQKYGVPGSPGFIERGIRHINDIPFAGGQPVDIVSGTAR